MGTGLSYIGDSGGIFPLTNTTATTVCDFVNLKKKHLLFLADSLSILYVSSSTAAELRADIKAKFKQCKEDTLFKIQTDSHNNILSVLPMRGHLSPISLTNLSVTMNDDEAAPESAHNFRVPDLRTVKTFEGRLDDDFIGWLAKFERATLPYHLTDLQRAELLPGYLEGRAAREWESLSPEQQANWDELRRVLVARLVPEEQTLLYSSQLRGRFQELTETVDAFANAVTDLGRKAYPHLSDEARDPFLRDHFMNQCKKTLMEAVWRAKPKTFADAVAAARDEESLRRVLNAKAPVTTEIKTSTEPMRPAHALIDPKFAEEMNELRRRVDKMEEQSRHSESLQPRQRFPGQQASSGWNSRDPNGRVICGYCGKVGHHISVCRSRLRGYNSSPPNYMPRQPNYCPPRPVMPQPPQGQQTSQVQHQAKQQNSRSYPVASTNRQDYFPVSYCNTAPLIDSQMPTNYVMPDNMVEHHISSHDHIAVQHAQSGCAHQPQTFAQANYSTESGAQSTSNHKGLESENQMLREQIARLSTQTLQPSYDRAVPKPSTTFTMPYKETFGTLAQHQTVMTGMELEQPCAQLIVLGMTEGRKARITLDTASVISLVSKNFLQSMSQLQSDQILPVPENQNVVSITGHQLKALGCVRLQLTLGSRSFQFRLTVTEEDAYDVLLGTDSLPSLGPMRIDWAGGTVYFNNDPVQLLKVANQRWPVCLAEDINIPQRCELILQAVTQFPEDTEGIMEPHKVCKSYPEVEAARLLLCPKAGRVPVRLVNLSPHSIVLSQGTIIAFLEPCNQPVLAVSDPYNRESSEQMNCEASTEPLKIQERDLVWAKRRCHPYSPARILSAKEIPPDFVAPKRKGTWIPVRFFGKGEYAYISQQKMVPFFENRERFEKVKNAELQKAIEAVKNYCQRHNLSWQIGEQLSGDAHLKPTTESTGDIASHRVSNSTAQQKKTFLIKSSTIGQMLLFLFLICFTSASFSLPDVNAAGINIPTVTTQQLTDPLLLRPGIRLNSAYAVLFRERSLLDNTHDFIDHHFAIPFQGPENIKEIIEPCVPVARVSTSIVSKTQAATSASVVSKTYAETACALISALNASVVNTSTQVHDQLRVLYDSIRLLTNKAESGQKRTKRGILTNVACFIESIFGGCSEGTNANEVRSALSALNDRVTGLSSEIVNINGRLLSLSRLTMNGFKNVDAKINLLRYGIETLETMHHDLIERERQLEHNLALVAFQQQRLTLQLIRWVSKLTFWHDQVNEAYSILDSLGDLERGFLPSKLVSPTVLRTALLAIDREIRKTGVGLTYSPVTDLDAYYKLPMVAGVLGNESFLLVRLRIPLLHADMQFTLFEITYGQLEMNGTILEVHHRHDYIGVNSAQTQYVLLTASVLSHCLGMRFKRCPQLLPVMPMSIISCEAALFRGLPDQFIHNHCEILVHKNKRPDQAYDLGEGEWFLAAVSREWRQFCALEAPSILSPCHHCILRLPCGCGLSMNDLTLPIRYQNCRANTTEVLAIRNPFIYPDLQAAQDTLMQKEKIMDIYAVDVALHNISAYLSEHLGASTSVILNFSKFTSEVLRAGQSFTVMDRGAERLVKHEIEHVSNGQTMHFWIIIALAAGEVFLFLLFFSLLYRQFGMPQLSCIAPLALDSATPEVALTETAAPLLAQPEISQDSPQPTYLARFAALKATRSGVACARV